MVGLGLARKAWSNKKVMGMSFAVPNPKAAGGDWGPPAPWCHQRGCGEGGQTGEARAVLEMLLCPVVWLGWNHKPQTEKHRCAAFFFSQ